MGRGAGGPGTIAHKKLGRLEAGGGAGTTLPWGPVSFPKGRLLFAPLFGRKRRADDKAGREPRFLCGRFGNGTDLISNLEWGA